MHMHEGFTRMPIKYLELLSLFQGDEALIFRARTKVHVSTYTYVVYCPFSEQADELSWL